MILGESEVERGIVQLKDLQKQTQDEVPRTEAAARVRALLSE
jgi:histidyl-tRNA synthetase